VRQFKLCAGCGRIATHALRRRARAEARVFSIQDHISTPCAHLLWHPCRTPVRLPIVTRDYGVSRHEREQTQQSA
jgi:hypothetical protein